MICFAQANKSFRNFTTERIYNQCHDPFLRNTLPHVLLTLYSLSLSLSLSLICSYPALIFTCPLPYKRLWFVHELYHWKHMKWNEHCSHLNGCLTIYYCEQPLSETTMWIKSVFCNQWWGGNGCQGIYIKQLRQGKEQDSGETERERECERQTVAGREG